MLKQNRTLFFIFMLVAAAEFGWGYYAVHVRDYIHGDSISRVANAFYVLYSRDPHLGAIGFIWNPLPSILEMVPLLFWKIAPAMASSGLSAVIISALFTAGASTLIYSHLRKTGVPLQFRSLITFAFACNPLVFMYGANGMSEMMFSFSIIWVVISFTEWMRYEKTNSLIQIGIALSLGFWIRYETVALGAAVAACIVIVLIAKWYENRDKKESVKELYARIEATFLLVLIPPVFSGLFWILLNYSIMGDPLFFLRSGYSNTAFVQDRSEELVNMTGNVGAVIIFVARKMLFFSIPAVALVITRLVTSRWLRWDLLVLITLVASIPAMQAAMLYQGSSYGWLRFFVYPFIVVVAWLPYEWVHLQRIPRRTLTFSILSVSILLSSGVIRDMNDQSFAPEEYGSLHMTESQTARDMKKGREIAKYLDSLIINRYPEKTLILTDSFSSFSMIVNIRHPQNLVITNDRDFGSALDDPQKHNVNYILVSRLEGAVLQVIHQKYPELFDKGMPWTELVKDFDGQWRLYRILQKED